MAMLKKRNIEKGCQVYLSETKRFINSELSNLVSNLSELNLHSQLEYALLSRGKRLRPILVILSAESVGGDRKRIVPLALAFELLHTATLVHDDIIDGEKIRRSIPALYKRWSVNDAILVGDALISMAIGLAADFGSEIMKIVAKSGLELCEGEYMDISQLLSTTTEEGYISKIRAKSAYLFRAAAQCGALAGGGSHVEAESLALFGEYFGIAYQIKDDLLDLTVSKSIPKDLRTGRITLPLIHLYKVSENGERSILENSLQILRTENCKVTDTVVERVLRSLKIAGSFKYCEQRIIDYIQRAIASIKPLKNTEFKIYLTQMARLLMPST